MEKEQIKVILQQSLALCPHKDEIKLIAIFGSYVNGTPRANSDVDILIDFTADAEIGFFALAHIKRFFEGILKITVDLLTPDSISRYFRDEVLKQAEYIYEK